MTRRNIFICTLIFFVLVLGIAFVSYRFFISDGDDSAIETSMPTDTPTNNHGEEPEETDPEPEITDDPPTYYAPYELEYEGDTSSPWHPIHFVDIRTPQPLYPGVPHGHISLRHIRYLNDYFYSRFPFSYQEKRAAAWIIEELLAMGYTWDNINIQEFDLISLEVPIEHFMMRSGQAFYHNYDYLRDTYQSQNVILTVPGQSGQVIVVGAHYDTVLYPGASDNASGTALLLESAQRMLDVDNYYTIVYIFFGAEEVGLFGAEYYVMNLTEEEIDNILFMVNADVLFEGSYFIFGGGYANRWSGTRTPGSNDITRRWEEIADELNLDDDFNIISKPDGIFLSSDQLVFMDAGLTVMMLYGTDFHPNGMYNFRVFHSYRDCYHYINNRWPYKIRDAMRTFNIFLERVLLAQY